MSYDETNMQIVKEYILGLELQPPRDFFVVDPPPIDSEKGK